MVSLSRSVHAGDYVCGYQEMARLARIEYADQTRQDRELHDRLMAERAEERYRKHYSECAGVLGDMLDFAAKVTEYRELTNK